MSPRPPSGTAMRVADLRANGDHSFSLRPQKPEMAEIAAALEFSAIRKLTFDGQLNPVGKTDWRLTGRLGATIVQPCVVTLDPVTTRIDVDVERTFVTEYEDPDDEEVEMTVDDTFEPLGDWIDPFVVMTEALALAAPDYPRKDSAELGEAVFTKPGEAPMTDKDARPFAGLADFKAQLENDED